MHAYECISYVLLILSLVMGERLSYLLVDTFLINSHVYSSTNKVLLWMLVRDG